MWNGRKKVKMLAKDGKKICSSCRRDLELSSFNKHKRTKDNLQNCCKECKAKMTKNWKYTMANGNFDSMKNEQNNSCYICKVLTEDLVIDHCHKSGNIRALLCRKCNALLGMCDDQLVVLKSAIDYLIKFSLKTEE